MIQRQSDKHNPRIDEEMVHETADLTHGSPVTSRSRDDLRQEDPAEVAPASPAPDPASPSGMAVSDVDLRSELAQCLRPSAFPANSVRLAEVAAEENAATWVTAALRQLPDDRQFDVIEELFEALGGHGEQARA